jgi:hypothetical protein
MASARVARTPPRHHASDDDRHSPYPNTPSQMATTIRRLPMPVSVDLIHAFPCNGQSSALQKESEAKKWYRREYSSSLLHCVRLELIVSETKMASEKLGNQDVACEEKILFSMLTPKPAVCPTWRHLDESMNLEELTIETYESMMLRFHWMDENNHCDESSKSHNPKKQSFPDDSFSLQIPIHPSKLIRIQSLPSSLPINAVLVHFSDGSIRVPPSVHQALEQASTVNRDAAKHHEYEASFSADDFSRFQDKAFNVLDQVTPVRKKSLLDAAEAAENGEEQHDGEDVSNSKSSEESLPQQQQLIPSIDLDRLPSWSTDDKSRKNQEHLNYLISYEEKQLQQEMLQLEITQSTLRSTMTSIESVRSQICEVQTAAQKEHTALSKAVLAQQAQHIQLLHELRVTYPIQTIEQPTKSTTANVYRIRGLSIPHDCLAGMVSDEELAAALGFLCHLLALLSKYLAIPLRYRTFSNSSRSVVQDDRATLYPLFLGRGTAEREGCCHAVSMLQANVICIAKAKDIDLSMTENHVLAQTKHIFDIIL